MTFYLRYLLAYARIAAIDLASQISPLYIIFTSSSGEYSYTSRNSFSSRCCLDGCKSLARYISMRSLQNATVVATLIRNSRLSERYPVSYSSSLDAHSIVGSVTESRLPAGISSDIQSTALLYCFTIRILPLSSTGSTAAAPLRCST